MSKEGRSYTTEDKQEAMGLYLRGHANTEIARKLNKRYNYNMTAGTVARWAEKGGWDEYRSQVEIDLIEHTKKTVVNDMAKNMHELEEVRQEFLKNLREGRADVRGHEFVKMTEMLGKLQDIETEKQDMVTHINKCINEALDEMEFDKRIKQKFLRAYIGKLRGEDV
ncbi:hypothetical protein [Marinobacter sp.]|jgi:transposase-like protein|uniref:terminase gpP N-terminus-related DNA-binding protein n=1 Tax=Marinobacter sp. TaxID=50741 RepID=UPI000C97713E|nr:hypothetical protein [Marinobacter sp.]MAK51478.1 hypothetical protein [Marinobacter sp.]|tara:strand:- start:1040 stop:1540 length:501 start_codon:yes stop_codon:yes gene_type:complete